VVVRGETPERRGLRQFVVGLAIAVVAGVLIWISREGLRFHDFMAAGPRFTIADARALKDEDADLEIRLRIIEFRVNAHQREDERLQVQLDVLEEWIRQSSKIQKPGAKPYAETRRGRPSPHSMTGTGPRRRGG
jgi:hypothetical protein